VLKDSKYYIFVNTFYSYYTSNSQFITLQMLIFYAAQKEIANPELTVIFFAPAPIMDLLFPSMIFFDTILSYQTLFS
jgi:hypothetical protein